MFQINSSSPLSFEDSVFVQFQTQKRICSEYIKIASRQLYAQQAQRISQANDLLQKLNSKESIKDLSQWDVFSTRDSVIFSDQASFSLSTISCEQPKIISRKNLLGSTTSRQFQQALSSCLQDIERDCSVKTANVVRKLSQEYKRFKNKVAQIQKKQKLFKSKEKTLEQLQEKNAILNKKIEELESTYAKEKQDNLNLKQEVKGLNQQIFKINSQLNSQKKIKLYQELTNSKVSSTPHKNSNFSEDFQILNQFLTQKENLAKSKYQQVTQIEERIQRVIFDSEEKCQGCCGMLKKMKQSIISYKQYLENEGAEIQYIYDNFKKSVEAKLSSYL